MTLIGAMNHEGIVATQMIEGSMKGNHFKDFIEKKLVPKLKEGDVVVMDNLKIHKMKEIEELITAKGARVEYLPTYSPDFNPIEMLWSTIKSFVRLFPTRALVAVEKLVELGLLLIEKRSFRNWFTKCCYCTS